MATSFAAAAAAAKKTVDPSRGYRFQLKQQQQKGARRSLQLTYGWFTEGVAGRAGGLMLVDTVALPPGPGHEVALRRRASTTAG